MCLCVRAHSVKPRCLRGRSLRVEVAPQEKAEAADFREVPTQQAGWDTRCTEGDGHQGSDHLASNPIFPSHGLLTVGRRLSAISL